MKISKDKARSIVENRILMSKRLPVFDEVIFVVENNSLENYNFRELIRYVYDLENSELLDLLKKFYNDINCPPDYMDDDICDLLKKIDKLIETK